MQGDARFAFEVISIYEDVKEMGQAGKKMKYESYVGKENEYKLVKRMVRCPACKQEVPFEGNPYRPFCSRGCKGFDLIGWASESYSIEGRPDEDNHNEEPE